MDSTDEQIPMSREQNQVHLTEELDRLVRQVAHAAQREIGTEFTLEIKCDGDLRIKYTVWSNYDWDKRVEGNAPFAVLREFKRRQTWNLSYQAPYIPYVPDEERRALEHQEPDPASASQDNS